MWNKKSQFIKHRGQIEVMSLKKGDFLWSKSEGLRLPFSIIQRKILTLLEHFDYQIDQNKSFCIGHPEDKWQVKDFIENNPDAPRVQSLESS